MSITPSDIQQVRFSEANPGYDPGEVDDFLEKCATDIDAMLHKIADLKGRLNRAEEQLSLQGNDLTQVQSASDNAIAAPSASSAEQVGSVLIVAQQTADKLVQDAERQADEIKSEADLRSREIIRQALEDKQDELDEIERLKTSRQEFRDEYMKLIKHFEDEANAVFPESLMTGRKLTGSNAQYSNEIPAQASAPASPSSTDSYANPAPQDQNGELGLGDLD